MKAKKVITITVTPEYRLCSRCGHHDDDDEPTELIVEDDGRLFDGGSVCDGDFMENDAKIEVKERAKAYRAKGHKVVISWK